jgi:hypothetical protein
MYFSHYDAASNRRIVETSPFEVLTAVTIDEPEDDGPAPFLWITARRRASELSAA